MDHNNRKSTVIFKSTLIYSFFVILFCWNTHGVSTDPDIYKELILTKNEKIVLGKFKLAVYTNLTQDYMKQDLFLLRWIRAKDLNLERAIRDMNQYLKFYEENEIDKILHEDWSDFEEEFPYNINITDVKGRPVAYLSVGQRWNIRSAVLQGRRDRVKRYIYKLMFHINQERVEANKKQPNVTQFVMLLNLEGFSLPQQACPLCVPIYLSVLDTYDKFFPGCANEIIAINSPQTFAILFQAFRPVLSKQNRDLFKIFGPNKFQWKSYLESKINPEKLNTLDID